MADEPRLRLGRGLAALIGEANDDARGAGGNRGVQKAPIEYLRPNPQNPRKSFDSGSLEELTESIREKGILQPIIVRELSGQPGSMEIIAGERRWRAAQNAGLHTVPVLVIEATDKESLEFAIIENVQRSDLNALEEAEGYARLIHEFSYTHADLGRVIGKSRSHVANTLRLLNLPENIKSLLSDGTLSAGHARALLALKDPESVAKRIVSEGLSVRDVERIAQDQINRPDAEAHMPEGGKAQKSPDTIALEKRLSEAIGLSVDLNHRGEKGEVRIRYKTLDQLDQLCSRLLPN